jgi:serine/threonine protein phosphatase PrpC
VILMWGDTQAYTHKHSYKCSDGPLDAQKLRFAVQAGDIVVLGTDGLFDNLSDKVQRVCVCLCV